jgi:hypothetical protein
MVSNINLVSSEVEKKDAFSGKKILVLSAVILILVFVLLFVILLLKGRYLSEKEQVSLQVAQQKSLLSGKEYADVVDFQSRLNLIEKVADDHAYWDGFLKKMSGYIIPDTRLSSFSGKIGSAGSAVVEVEGNATNMETASRGLILLKDIPGSTFEFKSIGENSGQAGEEKGFSFDGSLKIDKQFFQK